MADVLTEYFLAKEGWTADESENLSVERHPNSGEARNACVPDRLLQSDEPLWEFIRWPRFHSHPYTIRLSVITTTPRTNCPVRVR